jgi:hypothetical protein
MKSPKKRTRTRPPTVASIAASSLQEMRNLAEMVLQALKPAQKPAWQPPKQHPLVLNPNEGVWMHYCNGPVDGWFSFGDHGNPPFRTPVQVLFVDQDGKRLCVAIGTRTSVVDERVGKEKWEVVGQFDPFPGGANMTHWRFQSAPPATIKLPEPRP